MKCTEAKELISLYLDSELDARSAQEMQQHLAGCAGCARLARAEAEFSAALAARLNDSTRTPSLWMAEEAFVTESFRERRKPGRAVDRAASLVATWVSSCRALLWPSPKYYAGLAAVWLLLLLLRPAAPEATPQAAALRQRMSPESRRVLVAQRRELRELLSAPEPAPQDARPPTAPPRSEREGLPPRAFRPAGERLTA
jgi:hypothetical protein